MAEPTPDKRTTIKKGNTPPAENPNQDLQDRVTLFDRDFQALQNKYQLRAIAQVVLPGGAVLSVPIQVFPFPGSSSNAATDVNK